MVQVKNKFEPPTILYAKGCFRCNKNLFKKLFYIWAFFNLTCWTWQQFNLFTPLKKLGKHMNDSKSNPLNIDWYAVITFVEKGLLVVIAFLTVYAVVVEMITVVSSRAVTLTDLLLMFIYAEVLGMVAAFYKYRKIPITVPIFIAITALCRLIILQGKGINTIDLLYESGAILLLALSALIIRWNLINLVRDDRHMDE